MNQVERNEEQELVTEKEIELFLKEYEDLCRKHDMFVDACGDPEITTGDEIVSDGGNFEEELIRHVTSLGKSPGE